MLVPELCSSSSSTDPEGSVGDVDPEVVGVEEVVVQPGLRCVAQPQVPLRPLHHLPDLRRDRERERDCSFSYMQVLKTCIIGVKGGIAHLSAEEDGRVLSFLHCCSLHIGNTLQGREEG